MSSDTDCAKIYPDSKTKAGSYHYRETAEASTASGITPQSTSSSPKFDVWLPPPSNYLAFRLDDQRQLVRVNGGNEEPAGVLGKWMQRLSSNAVTTDGIELKRQWAMGRTDDGALVIWVRRTQSPAPDISPSGEAFDYLSF